MLCKTGKCIFKDDGVNEFVEKAYEADGFVFASPTYFAHPSGRLLSFLDRAFYSNGKDEVYDAEKDEEDLQVARNLARNMIWMMQASAAAKDAGIELPVAESEAVTNFIKREDKLR